MTVQQNLGATKKEVLNLLTAPSSCCCCCWSLSLMLGAQGNVFKKFSTVLLTYTIKCSRHLGHCLKICREEPKTAKVTGTRPPIRLQRIHCVVTPLLSSEKQQHASKRKWTHLAVEWSICSTSDSCCFTRDWKRSYHVDSCGALNFRICSVGFK